jgi:hypothetical protein
MSSKEIAQHVGLSPQTVDTYVKAAMAKLGTANRRDAARVLADYEVSHELGSPPAPVADRDVPDEPRLAIATGWRDLILPPAVGGSRNDLGALQRSYAVLKVALVGAVVVLGLTLAVAGTLYTFR